MFPGLKPEIEHDKLVRANERVRLLNEIEGLAAQWPNIVVRWKELTGNDLDITKL